MANKTLKKKVQPVTTQTPSQLKRDAKELMGPYQPEYVFAEWIEYPDQYHAQYISFDSRWSFWLGSSLGKTVLHTLLTIASIYTLPEGIMSMTNDKDDDNSTLADCTFEKLPDHLLIEVFIRVPASDFKHISCVKKQWANICHGECFWKAALSRTYPLGSQAKRWPGPIPRGLSKRRYTALYVGKKICALDSEIDEILGHTYFFLKDQLELSIMPLPSGILHGTMIDQFIACGKSRDSAHKLASEIWLTVLDHLEENAQTFLLFKRLAQESDVFLPYPYSRAIEVDWKIFDRLFTDFRDCFTRSDYYDVLGCAKNKFLPRQAAWLGY